MLRLISIIATLLLPFCISAQQLEVGIDAERLTLGPHLEWFEDPNGRYTIEDVSSASFSNRFQTNQESELHFGLTSSTYWVRFSLDWTETAASDAVEWILEIGPPKHVQGLARGGTDIYLFDADNRLLRSQRLGTYEAREELKTLQGGFAFRVDPETVRQVYIRAQSARELRLPVTLWQSHEFREHEISANTGFGIKYGILLAMICYNLFLFFSIHDRSFFYYVLAIGAQLSLLFFLSKHARFLELDQAVNPWLIDMLERNVYVLVGITYLQFHRHFLKLWRYDPQLDRWFIALMGFYGVALLLSFFPDEKVSQAVLVPAVIAGILIAFYANIDAILRGFEVAKVHLLASTIFLLGATVQVCFQIFQILPANWFTTQAYDIGIIAQALLLSFGLAYTYNIIKKEKEEAQRQAIQNLTRSEKIKDQLLANVSHELRTPVHGINGLVEVALHEFPRSASAEVSSPGNPALVRQNMELIRSGSRRLMRLIDDLLDFATVRRESTSLSFRPLNLHDQAALVLATCYPLVADKDVALVNAVPEELPLAEADEDRLQQILLNLTGNAIKFTDQGEVTISATLQCDDLPPDGRHIIVAVRDTGIGIPQREQTVIFKSFEKASTADTTAGVGLGLAISKELVELHDSELRVQSTPGEGSVFTFALRVSDAGDAAEADASLCQRLIKRGEYGLSDLPGKMGAAGRVPLQPEALESALEDQPATILIVDDEETNRLLLSQQLSQYRLQIAESGAEAIEAVHRKKPDLVLLDVMMPGMDGYQVCDELRRKYDQVDLPIIVVTAKNHLEDLIQGFGSGANDYLAKPFYVEELHSRVSNQLNLVRLQQLNAENAKLKAEVAHYLQAEKELTVSRLQLQRVLEGVTSGLIAFGYSGTIIYVNQKAADLLGLERSKLIDQPLATLLPDNETNSQLLKLLSTWAVGDRSAETGTDVEVELKTTWQPEVEGGQPDQLRFKARLSLGNDDDSTGILFLEEAEPPSDESQQVTLDLVRLLGQAQRNVRSLSSRIKLLTPGELENQPEVLQKIGDMDEIATFINERLPSTGTQDNYRHQLVSLMRCALHSWEISTNKSKIELAEESKIWAVSVDDGRLRTRTFDRYLRIDLLPKVPRWREVIRTAYFVLSSPALSVEVRETLKLELERTRETLEQAAIS